MELIIIITYVRVYVYACVLFILYLLTVGKAGFEQKCAIGVPVVDFCLCGCKLMC